MYQGERLNTATHFVGLCLAAAALVWLGPRMWLDGKPGSAAGFAIYGLSLLTVYGSSMLFHGTRGTSKATWAIVDHCAIYLLIGGTYTALALLSLEGPTLVILLSAVWLLCLWGLINEAWLGRSRRPSVRRYVWLGWGAVAALIPVMPEMNAWSLVALWGGAAVYTAGTLFYRNRRSLVHAHGVWHVFVIVGSACHFLSIAAQLRQG
ncbi:MULTISPECIES: hemolysin III family protein [unclassified Achromobacter]|uniref:PAQR family membrane homeostasis protein TrhA n=1 Tax=unclassified Achromobacter TaxID=2626865 RepID=UPI001303BD4C|nr:MULTISPECIES: hemolysin III family protein [unclassified Achromobacter]